MSSSVGKAAFALAAAVGAGLVLVVLIASQLPASKAADTLVTITSPTVNEAGLKRLREDFEQASDVADAVLGEGVSYLADVAGQTPAEFLAALETQAPEFSAGSAQYPEVQALADSIISNLEQRRGQFEAAASLPGLGLTLRDAVWIELAVGLLLIAVGVAGIMRPRTALAVVILGVGAALVVTPLALDHPSKTADTDAVLDSLRPFSQEKVAARETALATAYDLFDSFRDDVVPHAASQAGATVDSVAAGLESASADLSPASLTQLAVILDRFAALVDFSARIQPLLVTADELSARTTMWLLIGPGIALIVAGACASLATRRAS